METKSLRKISEAELTEAALSYSRNIIKIVEDSGLQNQSFLDSLDKVYDVQILLMRTNDSSLRAVERQIMDAYASTNGLVAPSDNLQKMGSDSLLYTKPLFEKDQKGALKFVEAIALRIHKKAVILSIKD